MIPNKSTQSNKKNFIGIHTLAFGHKSIQARQLNAPPDASLHDRYISAAEAAQEGRLFGENHMIQAGVDPLVFCREARFFRAVAQSSIRRQPATVNTLDNIAQEENRIAAQTIVQAAHGHAFADVMHTGIGPDEVESLQSLAHTWLQKHLPIEECISRIEAMLETLHENAD